MNNLESLLTAKPDNPPEYEPAIFDLTKTEDQKMVSDLFSTGQIHRVVDDYREEVKEYFQISNPSGVYAPDFEDKFQSYLASFTKDRPLWQLGRWVYYPWLSSLVHLLEDEAFQVVRTGRNRNLINSEEQNKFYNCTIGIAGLSVGNSVTLAIVLQGGAHHIKIADHDNLALSNLNRIRAGVEFLALPKVIMTARQIYSLNPYAKVEIFQAGLTPDNVGQFFDGLDLVIDEIDNLAAKYLIREEAKKRRLAVVMAADNGDNGVVDVERYDLDPQPEFFHGRLGEVSYDFLKSLDKFGIGKYITKHVGPENVTERMQQSLLEMGKTVVSWPQLGGAALLNGSAVAYCVRKILTVQPLENNRAVISLDEKLTPDYNSTEQMTRRQTVDDNFRKIFGL